MIPTFALNKKRMKNNSILLAVLLLILVGCSSKETINVSGSTTVLPVISIGAEQYIAQHNELNIIVNAGGSGVGINQLGEGKNDIAMASRAITKSEIDNFTNVDFNTIVVGKDAVVAVVSSEVYQSGVTSLSLKEIGDIYMGRINNWKELGGADKEILCIDKEKARGTRHVFMEIVLHAKEPETPGTDLVLGSNNETQTALTQSDAAIGMLSNAWINDDVVGLNIKLKNGSVVEPSLDNIINGKYPITRDLTIVTNGEPTGKTKDFIDYLLGSEGQKIVVDKGYVSIKK